MRNKVRYDVDFRGFWGYGTHNEGVEFAISISLDDFQQITEDVQGELRGEGFSELDDERSERSILRAISMEIGNRLDSPDLAQAVASGLIQSFLARARRDREERGE